MSRIWDDTVHLEAMKDIIELAEQYENEQALWDDAETFGQEVINRINELTDLDFKARKESDE